MIEKKKYKALKFFLSIIIVMNIVGVTYFLRSRSMRNFDLQEKQVSAPTFVQPRSSRIQILVCDPTLAYFSDRIGGTQVDVTFVPWATFLKEVDRGSAHSFPRPDYVVTSQTWSCSKTWLIDSRTEVLETKIPIGSHEGFDTFAFQFDAASKWVDDFSQRMMTKDPLHQELYLLNADLLKTELIQFAYRWKGIQSSGVSFKSKDLKLPHAMVNQNDSHLDVKIVDLTEKASAPSIALALKQSHFVQQSWLQVWDSNLRKLESVVSQFKLR